jgi:hypothetical protein
MVYQNYPQNQGFGYKNKRLRHDILRQQPVRDIAGHLTGLLLTD